MDAYYATRYTFNPARAVVWKEIVRFLHPFIPASATVLDLGAGYCDFINNVTAKEKIAVDFSPELSMYAAKDVRQVSANATSFPDVKADSVDVVHASNLLEHLDDVQLALTMGEVRRVLHAKGKLILLQPNYALSVKTYFDDPTHKKIFTDVSLAAFLESAGFKIVLKKARFLPFSMNSRPSFIPVQPWIVRLYLALPWKPFAGQMLFIAEKI